VPVDRSGARRQHDLAFREALTRARINDRPAIEVLFSAYEAGLRAAGYLAMGGQIVDAAVIVAPKQRNTEAEKAEIKAGRVPEAWRDKPKKLAQKDRDAVPIRPGPPCGLGVR
jgi:hypothetical protein